MCGALSVIRKETLKVKVLITQFSAWCEQRNREKRTSIAYANVLYRKR